MLMHPQRFKPNVLINLFLFTNNGQYPSNVCMICAPYEVKIHTQSNGCLEQLLIAFVMTLTTGHFGAMCVVIDKCSNYIQENNEWIGCSTWKPMITQEHVMSPNQIDDITHFYFFLVQSVKVFHMIIITSFVKKWSRCPISTSCNMKVVSKPSQPFLMGLIKFSSQSFCFLVIQPSYLAHEECVLLCEKGLSLQGLTNMLP